MNRVERLKEKKAAKSHYRKVLLKRGLLISSVAAIVVVVVMCYFFFIRDSAKPVGKPGESAEIATEETAEPPPVIPGGVQTWRQVADKMAADSAYNSLVEDLTGLDLAAVDALAVLEERGMVLRTSLPAGTFLINSGSNENGYFSFNQYLPQDREALTDTSGKPQVLTHCGNPMTLVPPSEYPPPQREQPEEPGEPAPDVPPEEEPVEPPPPPPPPGPVPCPPEPPPAVEPPPPPPPPGPVPCPTPGEEEPAPEIPPDQDPEPPSGEEEPGSPADDAPVT